MLRLNKYFRSGLLGTAVLLPPVMITGCAVRASVGYRYYDPGHADYHEWNDREGVYYRRWAGERHRDEHREFRKLKPDEQKDYWNWRHDHPDDRR
jgi:hypothetical protein